MKPVRNFFNYILTLALLLAVGAGAVWLLGQSEPANPLTAQEVEATPASATATLTPTVEATATVTPAQTLPDELPAEQIEPTWTRVIVLPEGTAPPVPTAPPAPTATPPNPNEKLIMELKSTTGPLAISPNGQEIAFSQLNAEETEVELWKLNLANRKLEMLSTSGGRPQWSPNGETVLFERWNEDDTASTGIKVEIRTVNSNGLDEKVLATKDESELLDYHWTPSGQIELITPTEVVEMNQTGQVTNRVDLSIPDKNNASLLDVKVSSKNFIIFNEEKQLRVLYRNGRSVVVDSPPSKSAMPYDNGEDTTTSDPLKMSIGDFSLSPDNRKIAYITIDGPIEALWVADLTTNEQRKLFELSNGGSIVNPGWSPNGKFVVIGHRPTGTYDGPSYELTMIQVETGEIVNLQVDKASNFVWGPDGKNLYYTRSILIDKPAKYSVTLNQLRLQ